MAAIPVTIVGQDGNGNPITIIGMISLTGVGVGGGPIIPSTPPGIWPGPGDPDFPGGGGGGSPPGIWGPPGPWPTPPIAFPPGWIGGVPPPDWTPPPDVTVPPPGSPPQVVGGPGVVNPIVPPPFIIIRYPGIGMVVVPQPVPSEGSKRK